MNRCISALVAGFLVLGMTGCASGETATGEADAGAPVTASATTAEEPATSHSAEPPTEAATHSAEVTAEAATDSSEATAAAQDWFDERHHARTDRGSWFATEVVDSHTKSYHTPTGYKTEVDYALYAPVVVEEEMPSDLLCPDNTTFTAVRGVEKVPGTIPPGSLLTGADLLYRNVDPEWAFPIQMLGMILSQQAPPGADISEWVDLMASISVGGVRSGNSFSVTCRISDGHRIAFPSQPVYMEQAVVSVHLPTTPIPNNPDGLFVCEDELSVEVVDSLLEKERVASHYRHYFDSSSEGGRSVEFELPLPQELSARCLP